MGVSVPLGVVNGPLNGISDGPMLVGIYMKEVEVRRLTVEEACREDKCPGDGSAGLKKFSSI